MGEVVQIDYSHIARGIMGLHTSEELDDPMTRATSMEEPASNSPYGRPLLTRQRGLSRAVPASLYHFLCVMQCTCPAQNLTQLG